MKILLSIIIISTFFCTGVSAQEEEKISPGKKYFHHIGINTGSTSGIGFSYKYHPSKVGVQLTVLPPLGEDMVYCVGLTAIYRLVEAEGVNFVGYGAIGSASYIKEGSPNACAGMGIETFSKQFGMTALVGYAIYGIGNFSTPFISTELGIFCRF